MTNMEHSEEDSTVISKFSFLPNEILVEILCWLPDESLVKFKSVSKAWNVLISETCIPLLPSRPRPAPLVGMFLRTYNLEQHRFITRSTRFDLCDYFWYDICSCRIGLGRSYLARYLRGYLFGDYGSLNEDKDKEQLFGWQECLNSYGLPFRPAPDDFLGCCNGLLLFVSLDLLQYYVSNPTTRQCVSIPWPPLTPKEFYFAALAFDPSRSSCYKLIRFESRRFRADIVLDIYSSANKSWTRHSLLLDSLLSPSSCIRAATYFDGELFRLSQSWRILRFDLEEVTIKAIQLPSTPEQYNKMIGSIGVLMSQLCYGNQCSNMVQVHIWTLERSDTWSLRHKISICDLSHGLRSHGLRLNREWGCDDSKWVEPVAFHPTANVVYLGSPIVILSYDLNNGKFTKLFKKKEFSFLPGSYFPAFPYVRFLTPFTEAGDIRSCS